MELTLEVVSPNGQSLGLARRKVFGPEGGRIGRSPDCEWVLANPYISRHHATVRWISGTYYIESTGENGVAVNSPQALIPQRERRALRNGDRIYVDEYEIAVVIAAAEAPLPSGDGPMSFAPADDPLASLVGSGRPTALVDPLEPSHDELDPLKQLGGTRGPATAPADLNWNHTPGLNDQFTPPSVPPRTGSASAIPDDWDRTSFGRVGGSAPAPIPAPVAPMAPVGASGSSAIPDDWDKTSFQQRQPAPPASPPPQVPSPSPPQVPTPGAGGQRARGAPMPLRPAPSNPAPMGSSPGSAAPYNQGPASYAPGAPVSPPARQSPVYQPSAPQPAEYQSGRQPPAQPGSLEDLLSQPAADADEQATVPPPPVRPAPTGRPMTPPGARPVAPSFAPSAAAGGSSAATPAAGSHAATGSYAAAAASSAGATNVTGASAPPGDFDITTLLRSAGVDPASVPPETAASLGLILRTVVQGVVEVLQARTEVKNQFRMALTRIKTAENNPLKFSVNAEDALNSLLGRRSPAYLAPVEAFEDAFDDIRFHQMAMLAGMRAGFENALQRFDPQRLQEVFDKRVKRGMLQMGAKSRYWELYADEFRELTGDPDDAFKRLFGEVFAAAYEQQLEELKRSRGKPPR
jgi:type VI secretion system FHA domain protein